MKSCFSFNALIFIVIVILTILNVAGIFQNLSDLEYLKEFLVNSNGLGEILYFCISFLNVIFLPVPAFILYVVGVSLFGPWTTFLLSSLSVILGSII